MKNILGFKFDFHFSSFILQSGRQLCNFWGSKQFSQFTLTVFKKLVMSHVGKGGKVRGQRKESQD